MKIKINNQEVNSPYYCKNENKSDLDGEILSTYYMKVVSDNEMELIRISFISEWVEFKRLDMLSETFLKDSVVSHEVEYKMAIQTIQDVIDNLGSVQHVSWMTEEEKQVFLNAFEMDQRILLRHASQRQRYTCQGQSLNFYVPEDGSEDLISDLLTMLLLDDNVISQYYIYSRSGVVIKDECIACSA